jgi:hypothetical protein
MVSMHPGQVHQRLGVFVDGVLVILVSIHGHVPTPRKPAPVSAISCAIEVAGILDARVLHVPAAEGPRTGCPR